MPHAAPLPQSGLSSWRWVAASVTGQAHLARGEGGQDAYRVQSLGGAGLVLAVSDGAGSASQAAHASAWLCDEACRWCAAQVRAGEKLDAQALLTFLQGGLQTEADALGVPRRELAATLGLAVVRSEGAWCFGVGDSAVLADWDAEDGKGTGLRPVFWPQQGEYANQTLFVGEITSEQAQTRTLSGVRALALLTDGLHPAALQLAERQAHAGFFAPLLSALQGAAPGDLPALQRSLAALLDSGRMRERSDDDKTLVLALRPAEDRDG